MIIVTGAAGFIGSCLAGKLNAEGYKDLVLVDDFSSEAKQRNIAGLQHTEQVPREDFFDWLKRYEKRVQFIFHIGARTDTTTFDKAVFDRLNVNYSKKVWRACVEYGIPLVYASSAATYGGGEQGYADDEARIPGLRPLNPYGESKQTFDRWALEQPDKPYFWAGIKFFNVYGPNEYHKGRMASVVYHAWRQAKDAGQVKLFRAHHPDYEDGKQLRDFIYVKDVVEVLYFLMHHRRHSGIYNLGSGKARTFLDLARSVFDAMGREPDVQFIDTPADIRDKYQYFTEAKMDKLRAIGYEKSFHSIEAGVADYVKHYLESGKHYGD